jgi:hypothetical protein
MRIGLESWRMLALAGGAALLAACAGQYARDGGDATLHAGADELAGVVTGSRGPEAGVWVIAETTNLPTRFAKIVVTDDRGRYLMPELPKAAYEVWVRGYGLVDSPKVTHPRKCSRCRPRTVTPRCTTRRRGGSR